MLEDADLLFELTDQETSRSGIAYFISDQERKYNIEWANEIRNGKWIKRNWNCSRADNIAMDSVGKKIASCDGVISSEARYFTMRSIISHFASAKYFTFNTPKENSK